jgi:hypothetical protein
VDCDLINQDSFRATNYVYYRKAHKWWYLSNKLAAEACIMKIHDSDKNVKARCKIIID